MKRICIKFECRRIHKVVEAGIDSKEAFASEILEEGLGEEQENVTI